MGLSTMDILSSFFLWFLGSWAMPKGSWIWTAGNIVTCDIAAAIGGIGYIGSSLYNCSLATFYLLQLKYNWSDRKMKSIENVVNIVVSGFAYNLRWACFGRGWRRRPDCSRGSRIGKFHERSHSVYRGPPIRSFGDRRESIL